MESVARHIVATGLVAALTAFAIGSASASDPTSPTGRARNDTRLVPAVEAAFQRESYRPNRRARLVIRDRSRHLTIQILEAGPEIDATASDTEMNGVPVTRREGDHSPDGSAASLGAGRPVEERALLRPAGGTRRTHRVRTVRGRAQPPRDSPRRGRPPDADLAGLQLPRRRRRRKSRLVVRGEAAEHRPARAERSSIAACRTGMRFHLGFLHWLALDGQARRLPLTVGPRATSGAARRSDARTT